MHLHHRRERTGTGRAVKPRQQRAAALLLVFDILDADLLSCLGFERVAIIGLLRRACASVAAAMVRRLPHSARHSEAGLRRPPYSLLPRPRGRTLRQRIDHRRTATTRPTADRSGRRRLVGALGRPAGGAVRGARPSAEGVSLAELSATVARAEKQPPRHPALDGRRWATWSMATGSTGSGRNRSGWPPTSWRCAGFPSLVRPVLQDLQARSRRDRVPGSARPGGAARHLCGGHR